MKDLPPGQHVVKDLIYYSALEPPYIDIDSYGFTVGGDLEVTMEKSYTDLLKMIDAKFESDFHCVTGWTVRGVKWEGIHLKTIIDAVKPRGDHLLFRCLDGYTTAVSVRSALSDDGGTGGDGEGGILVLKINGEALTYEQGFPLRPFFRSLYGWKSAKWLSQIKVISDYQDGYWEERGCHERGNVWEEERFKREDALRLSGPCRVALPNSGSVGTMAHKAPTNQIVQHRPFVPSIYLYWERHLCHVLRIGVTLHLGPPRSES